QWHQVEINTGRLHVRRSKKSTPSVHPTRSLKIDDQLEFGRLRHRQVGRLGALQDAPGIGADLTITVFKVRPVAPQSADCHKITPRISRRNPAARRQGGKLHGAADEECIGTDEESIWMLTLNGGKGRIDLAAGAGFEYLDLQPDGGGGFLHDP